MSEDTLLFIGHSPSQAEGLLRLFRQQEGILLHICQEASAAAGLLKRLQPRVVLLGTDMLLAEGHLDLQQLLSQKGAPPLLFIHHPSHLPEDILLQNTLSWGAFDILNLGEASWQSTLLTKIELMLPLGRQIGRQSHWQMTPATGAGHSAQGQARLPLRLVLIGASTGGPQALAVLLAQLPQDFAVPILVVQHLPGSWTTSLAQQLNQLSPLEVREARAQDQLQNGTVLVVPGNQQVSLSESGQLTLFHRSDLNRPSVNLALLSACEAFGRRTLAVILTGMGNDGLEGVQALKKKHGKCLAEHASSCVVYGMPRAVIEAGLADKVAPLERLAQEIRRAATA
jgi:two-component system chemotaxis response regulator CheB